MRHNLKVHDDTGNDLVHLAESLIKHLGIDGALQVCRENSWEGVITIIKGHKSRLIGQ